MYENLLFTKEQVHNIGKDLLTAIKYNNYLMNKQHQNLTDEEIQTQLIEKFSYHKVGDNSYMVGLTNVPTDTVDVLQDILKLLHNRYNAS